MCTFCRALARLTRVSITTDLVPKLEVNSTSSTGKYAYNRSMRSWKSRPAKVSFRAARSRVTAVVEWDKLMILG